LNQLSASSRSKIRRLRPRLEAKSDGDVRVTDFETPGPGLDEAINGFLAMEAQGWKGRHGGAMACHPGHAEFFREVCQRLAKTGSLQIRALQAGSKTLGYQCNLFAGDTLLGFKTTFDETFREYFPGVILAIDTIASFHANERLAVLDSCMGPDPTRLHDLFLDRRRLVDALVSLDGPLGQAPTRLTPVLATAYQRAKRSGQSVKNRLRVAASRPT
jgi:CelD/BcsL family acetyltransferase involved in cellulose biosynthesis